MKNLLIIFFFALLYGCARKTYTANSSKYSNQAITLKDSLGNTSSVIVDKTITVKTRQYDTSFKISGNKLIGYIELRSPQNINKHYENEDVSLDLITDSTGTVHAIATPKTKSLIFKLNEKTIAYNDIQKTEQEQSNTRFKTQTKTDSVTSFNTKLIEPTLNANPIKTATSVLILIVLVCVVIFLFRKFNVVGRLIRWISGLV